MNISLDRLKYFIEVAKLEHVNNAAKRLNISASVVSESIRTLEQELEVELFDRVKRKLHLTKAGHELLNKAQKIIDDVHLLYQQNSTSLSGEFKLGISLSLFRDSSFALNKLITTVKGNPRLQVSFNTSDTGRLIDLVTAGLLDAAVVYSPIQHENIIEQVIEDTQFKIALKKNHAIFDLSKKEQIKMLSDLPAIGFSASAGDNMCQRHPIFDKFGITPNYQYFYDVDEVAVTLAVKTKGWIFTSDNIIAQNKSLKVLELGKDWDVPMRISLIRNRNKPKSPVIDQVWNLL